MKVRWKSSYRQTITLHMITEYGVTALEPWFIKQSVSCVSDPPSPPCLSNIPILPGRWIFFAEAETPTGPNLASFELRKGRI